jgi:16S rRNA (guanine527-N7)-methyltransferase
VADPADGQAFRERLQQGAGRVGIGLEPVQLETLERYFQLLLRWNRTMNLTALPLEGLPDRTLNRIFIEPFQAAQLVDHAALRWFDLGSGGGSPAVPLKVVRPQLRLTMVESRSRKAAFLREVVRFLAFTATDVLSVRIEELGDGVRGQADLLTARAVRIDEPFLRTAATVLRTGGQLFLFGSRPSDAQNADFEPTEQLDLTESSSALYVLRKIERGPEDRR